MGFAVVGLVAAVFVSMVPAGADAEECAPYTRSDLIADRTPTTTAAAEIDPLQQSMGRGMQPPDDGASDAPTVSSQPDEAPTRTQPRCDFVYPMEFPLVGAGSYGSGFGAPRDGGARLHMGVDMMAPKLTPVVAVADATVAFIRDDPDSKNIGLLHDDGWESWYIHLNNDTYGTDDGLGQGIRPDLAVGDRVTAGEVIAWVGDSGNAETTPSHLHFELHEPGGEPVDAWPSVRAAMSVPPAALTTAAQTDLDDAVLDDEGVIETLAARVSPSESLAFVGPFVDDEGLPAEALFARLTASGVDVSCDDWHVSVCPDEAATGADAESWIAAVSDNGRDPSVAIDYTTTILDPGPDRRQLCGIDHLCPDAPVSLGEVAAMLIGSVDTDRVLTPDAAVTELARSGATPFCGPRDPASVMTRAELAELLIGFVGGASVDCSAVS